MKFETYIAQAWTDHANHPQQVADGFLNASSYVETAEQLIQLVGLVTHVMGEHLGMWTEGQALLEGFQANTSFAAAAGAQNAIQRSLAVMKIGRSESPDMESFSLSDKMRVFAVTASALSGRDVDRAQECLLKALDLARHGLDGQDPASRVLAVTGNNLACALEEKKSRTLAETEFMILSARTAREYWEIAGGWLEVSRAEYRLAMSYLEAADTAEALRHAQTCLEMCGENMAGDLDLFFAFEVLAKVERFRRNDLGFKTARDSAIQYFEKLGEDDKQWCESALKKLTV